MRNYNINFKLTGQFKYDIDLFTNFNLLRSATNVSFNKQDRQLSIFFYVTWKCLIFVAQILLYSIKIVKNYQTSEEWYTTDGEKYVERHSGCRSESVFMKLRTNAVGRNVKLLLKLLHFKYTNLCVNTANQDRRSIKIIYI